MKREIIFVSQCKLKGCPCLFFPPFDFCSIFFFFLRKLSRLTKCICGSCEKNWFNKILLIEKFAERIFLSTARTQTTVKEFDEACLCHEILDCFKTTLITPNYSHPDIKIISKRSEFRRVRIVSTANASCEPLCSGIQSFGRGERWWRFDWKLQVATQRWISK